MKKILVIDDDQDILEAVQMVLESGGYESNITTKGEEIYEKIDEYKPDLILLDVLLSCSDGRNICKNLKKENKTKKIPIIMLSAHPTAKDSVKECGANSFIAKPFSVTDLLAQIEKYIG